MANSGSFVANSVSIVAYSKDDLFALVEILNRAPTSMGEKRFMSDFLDRLQAGLEEKVATVNESAREQPLALEKKE